MLLKKIAILCLFSLNSLLVNAQFTYFNNRYNNDNNWSFGLSILESELGYVIAGCSGVESNGYIFRRIVLSAIDHQGNLIWWKPYGEDFHNYYAGLLRGCIKTSDGGFAISGSVQDSIGNVGILIKFNSNGDSIWSRIYEDPLIPGFDGIIFEACMQLPDEGYLITGCVGVIYGDEDILLIRTDSTGNMVWYQTYGESEFVETGYSIALLPGGEFLIGFITQNVYALNTADPGMLKVDSLGNEIWTQYYGGPFDDFGCSVTLSQDGSYLMGSTYAISEPVPGFPLQKICIFKTDTSGNVLWEGKYSEALITGEACTIDELEDGTIISSGHGGFDDCLSTQGYIIKVDQDGDSIWMRRYNYYPEDGGFLNDLLGLHLTSDNGIIITGSVLGYPEWEQSMWVQKLDSIGCDSIRCDTTVGIFEYPGDLEVWENGSMKLWPNPASDRIYIMFRLDNLSHFTSRDREMEIFNVFGEKVFGIKMSIFQETYSQDISSLSQGLYLVVIRERQKVVCTGKFLIAR
jgi:hypothetical protein